LANWLGSLGWAASGGLDSRQGKGIAKLALRFLH